MSVPLHAGAVWGQIDTSILGISTAANSNHVSWHDADRTREVELEASVVNLKHAADADDAGLINPLLKRTQQHLLPEKVCITVPKGLLWTCKGFLSLLVVRSLHSYATSASS